MSDHFHEGQHWSCESIDKRLLAVEARNTKLEAVARAAERFISQDRRKATVKEMLDVDGDLAVALAALHAPTEGKENK